MMLSILLARGILRGPILVIWVDKFRADDVFLAENSTFEETRKWAEEAVVVAAHWETQVI